MTDQHIDQRNLLKTISLIVQGANDGRLFVAAYGSLPGRPSNGLTPIAPVKVYDFEKSMCVQVSRCRGQTHFPGLVAGLVPHPGSEALGMLMEITEDVEQVLDDLAARELFDLAYEPATIACKMLDGSTVLAIGFIASLRHEDFFRVTPHRAANIISTAAGDCGTNREYLCLVTQFEIDAFGEVSPSMAAIAARLAMDKSSAFGYGLGPTSIVRWRTTSPDFSSPSASAL